MATAELSSQHVCSTLFPLNLYRSSFLTLTLGVEVRLAGFRLMEAGLEAKPSIEGLRPYNSKV